MVSYMYRIYLKGQPMTTTNYVTLRDYDGELTTVSIRSHDITALNFIERANELIAFKDAIAGITLGEIVAFGFKDETAVSMSLPTDPQAQRETKWLVSYRDTTQYLNAPLNSIANPSYGRVFNFEIGTADLSKLMNNRGEIDMTDPQVTAFVDALAEVLLPPNSWTAPGASYELLSIRHVGRNS